MFIAVFAMIYFGVSVPLFQAFSKRRRGRKFVIRLGASWNVRDPDHRWDVGLSFLSFVLALALALSIFLFDLVVPFDGKK